MELHLKAPESKTDLLSVSGFFWFFDEEEIGRVDVESNFKLIVRKSQAVAWVGPVRRDQRLPRSQKSGATHVPQILHQS